MIVEKVQDSIVFSYVTPGGRNEYVIHLEDLRSHPFTYREVIGLVYFLFGFVTGVVIGGD